MESYTKFISKLQNVGFGVDAKTGKALTKYLSPPEIYSSVPELRPFSLCEGCSSLLLPVLDVKIISGGYISAKSFFYFTPFNENLVEFTPVASPG